MKKDDKEVIEKKNNFIKKRIIVVFVFLILVGLCIFFFKDMFGFSSNPSTNNGITNNEGFTKEQFLRVGEDFYTISELEEFIYMYKIVNEEEDKNIKLAEMEDFLYEFLAIKFYCRQADKLEIDFPAEEVEKAKEYYSGEVTQFNGYGITEEEYLKYAAEDYRSLHLASNFSEYYELPDEMYQEFVNSFSGDELKTYTFRCALFVYEEQETSGDVEYVSKIDAESNAKIALDLVKKGGDFETIVDEYSDASFIITPDLEYFVNGEEDYAIQPLLASKLGSSELAKAVESLKIGEYTEVYKLANAPYYAFVKLENVEDGFVGKADAEVRDLLLEEYESSIVYDEVDYDLNQDALTDFISKLK